MTNVTICPVCGGTSFSQTNILWPELVAEWELQPYEINYINEQQGFACSTCRASLRAMTLAQAIMTAFHFQGLFRNWVSNRRMSVLEINKAQMLTSFTSKIRGHVLAEYPQVDMHALPYPDHSFDLVIHSDTLEHVADPVTALSECRRVLRVGGYLAYTIPIVVGRLSRSRATMAPSYHGSAGENASDYLVYTEFGADFWNYTIRAGFDRVEILTYRYPASTAILASNLIAPGTIPRSFNRRFWSDIFTKTVLSRFTTK